jgi:hypothetical protein
MEQREDEIGLANYGLLLMSEFPSSASPMLDFFHFVISSQMYELLCLMFSRTVSALAPLSCISFSPQSLL